MTKLGNALVVVLLLAIGAFAQKAEQISLAVSDLASQGVKESEAMVLSEQLRAALMKLAGIRLVERSQMQEILKEQGFQQSGCTNDACAVEVGQLLGVNNIVVGSVGIAGSYTVISVRVISVSTGSIIANESIRTKGGIDKVLESGIGQAVEKLSAALFPADIQTAPPVASQGRGRAKRLIFIGGGAVLVGGGIVAAVVLSKNDEAQEHVPAPNTRIELP
jgi:TolB-like protein